MSNEASKWDMRLIHLAEHISCWSKDPSTKCGAVIVDQDRFIVSAGYNGFPIGIEDSKKRLEDRVQKYELMIHAEINAILTARQPLEGCTLYTWPFFPCVRCATQIVQKQILRVVAPTCPPDKVDRWKDSFDKTKMLFREAEISYTELNLRDSLIVDSHEPTYGLGGRG